ncbi:hypothetical protein HHI36_018310 [Cryptolaemus montrouzieri]|uniref:Uncharacterized protein n=1 Tax=Cryptolaemus montrouzieri TaxID=559131 RepID=A0ABD2P0H1_9CUCU
MQPLDNSFYRFLKSYWQKSLHDYIRHHPEKPNRTSFHEILYPALKSSFSHNNITNAFKKAGICLLDCNVITKEVTVPSALTAAPLAVTKANEARVAGIGEILEIPQPPEVPITIEIEHQPSTSGATSSRQMETSEDDDDWVCGKG